MYLKNISLRGFKSFGTKNSLMFEPGISIIVGPNGSGKSNIVDAISWVLGEQSPKSLRGVSMGDVIFKSKNEKLAIAEVSLIFDNTDRMLPVEFAEVKFTRRAYIKGGSEYFINSSPCRLADIQDLTAESGIGKGLYTIISQGQVNNVVLYKPTDRKHVIDEIIGVSRHKTRRDKSKARLEAVEGDINRANDLLHEVKRTMDPLASEAKKSRIFSDLSQEMKNLELSLFISTINGLNKKWDEEITNYDKNLIDLDEADRKIHIVNSQKKEYETIFYREKENFTSLESKSNYFNLLCSQLTNIKTMVLNQKTSIVTIINMIKFSMNDVTDAFNNKNTGDIKTQNEDTVDKKDVEKAIEKINLIFELSDNFFNNIQEWALPGYMQYITEFKKQLVFKLNDIKELLISGFEPGHEEVIIAPQEEAPKNKINLEDRLNKLKNILEYAQSNITSLDMLTRLLANLKDQSDIIETKISAKLIREEHSLNSSQSKLNRCFEELNKLNSKKTFLENEIYRSDLKKEQIKEKVKDLSIKNFDEYNMPVDFIMKNFKAAENIEKCESRVRELRGELAKYRNINPNAHLEYEKVKERFEFLENQKNDLSESKKELNKLIIELNQKIREYFNEKFNLINENFWFLLSRSVLTRPLLP